MKLGDWDESQGNAALAAGVSFISEMPDRKPMGQLTGGLMEVKLAALCRVAATGIGRWITSPQTRR
jgi:dihydroorotase-like cyclic amidohydrolase